MAKKTARKTTVKSKPVSNKWTADISVISDLTKRVDELESRCADLETEHGAYSDRLYALETANESTETSVPVSTATTDEK